MISWSELANYGVVFGTLVVSAFGVPIPEEAPIVAGGIMVGKEWANPDSWMKWWIMLPVCIAGVVSCDIVLYVIGRKWGVKLLQRKWVQKRILSPEKRVRIERNFHAYGIIILLVARLLPGIRSPIFIMAGVMKVPFRKFLIADGLYAIPGVNLLFWLSYWFTDQFQKAFHKVEGNRPIVVVAILAVVAGFLLYHYFVRRRVTTGDPQELPEIVKHMASSISHQLHLGHADPQEQLAQPQSTGPDPPPPPAIVDKVPDGPPEVVKE